MAHITSTLFINLRSIHHAYYKLWLNDFGTELLNSAESAAAKCNEVILMLQHTSDRQAQGGQMQDATETSCVNSSITVF